MALDAKTQIRTQLEGAENILICIGQNAGGDGLGAALGLGCFLKKLKKKVDIISPRTGLKKYAFMPGSALIGQKVQGARDYVFALPVKKEDLHQLRYEVEDGKLKLFVTVKSGAIDTEQVTVESAKFHYDLIVSVGATDLENLDGVYDDNPEMFFAIPVINIDHQAGNEQFGKINWVDLSVASTSEMILKLIKEWNASLLDEKIATNLLTGIIAETESFQNKRTTPQVFLTAAELISQGADKESIVRYLYKTKSIAMLKLMGRIMSELKYNSNYKFAWSVLSKESIRLQPITQEDLYEASEEMFESSPEFEVLMILHHAYQSPECIIRFSEKIDGEKLCQKVQGHMENRQIHFTLENMELAEAEKAVLTQLKEFFDEK